MKKKYLLNMMRRIIFLNKIQPIKNI